MLREKQRKRAKKKETKGVILLLLLWPRSFAQLDISNEAGGAVRSAIELVGHSGTLVSVVYHMKATNQVPNVMISDPTIG